MAVETDEPRCVVVLPPADNVEEYTDLFEPAVEAAEMVPERAVGASSQRDKRRLCDQINGADVVLADVRTLDPFCYFALGIAEAASRRILAVVTSRDNLPFTLEEEEVIEFERAAPKATQELIGLITEHLTADASPSPGIPARDGSPAPQGGAATGSSGISRQEAQALINAMWADGLQKKTIRRELLAAGVSPSWIELRLRALHVERRSGW